MIRANFILESHPIGTLFVVGKGDQVIRFRVAQNDSARFDRLPCLSPDDARVMGQMLLTAAKSEEERG